MKLTILGSTYDYEEIQPNTCKKMAGLDGFCDGYEKVIRVNEQPGYKSNVSELNTTNMYLRELRRHEIIHAFFHESGLEEYNNNEELVNWIALQFPKMIKVFEEVEAL